MEHHALFNEAEQKIRKNWLFFLKIPAFFLVLLLFTAFVAAFINFVYALIFVGVAALGAGLLYIPYHCAYKKPGTIYLLLLLIALPIEFVLDLFKHFKEIPAESDYKLMVLKIVLFSLGTAYSLAIFYYSFKLRRINKNMQNKILVSSEEYSQASASFLSATNLQELDEKFRSLVHATDSSKARNYIAKAYKARKKTLQTAPS